MRLTEVDDPMLIVNRMLKVDVGVRALVVVGEGP